MTRIDMNGIIVPDVDPKKINILEVTSGSSQEGTFLEEKSR